jgi:hypothetical protein
MRDEKPIQKNQSSLQTSKALEKETPKNKKGEKGEKKNEECTLRFSYLHFDAFSIAYRNVFSDGTRS